MAMTTRVACSSLGHPLQVVEAAAHPHAVDLQVALGRIVVQEAHREVGRTGIAHHPLHQGGADPAGAGDEDSFGVLHRRVARLDNYSLGEPDGRHARERQRPGQKRHAAWNRRRVNGKNRHGGQ